MPAPRKGPRLASTPAHEKAMLANIARSLFVDDARHAGGKPGRVKTTEARAKAARAITERMITKAKSGTVHDRRQVLKQIEDRDVVHWLFSNIATRYEDRDGGYTRVIKIGPRKGDGAPMAYLELV